MFRQVKKNNLCAPDGTWKTSLINLLLIRVRSAVNVALTIALFSIPEKGAVHFWPNIPIYVHEHPVCHIKKNSMTAQWRSAFSINAPWVDECLRGRRLFTSWCALKPFSTESLLRIQGTSSTTTRCTTRYRKQQKMLTVQLRIYELTAISSTVMLSHDHFQMFTDVRMLFEEHLSSTMYKCTLL